MITRVIKWGGSLFADSQAALRFEDWYGRQSLANNIVVAGGGSLVNSLRACQADFQLDDVDCHSISLDAMSITARLVHRLIPASSLTSRFHDLSKRTRGLSVFDANQWIRARDELPKSWSLTSDSIAALVAVELSADELVLLKSSLPNRDSLALEELARSGFVDDCFPAFGRRLNRIRIVNLRSPGEEIELVSD